MEKLRVGDVVKATQKFSVGDSVTVVDINRMYILDSDPPKEGAPARVVGLSEKSYLDVLIEIEGWHEGHDGNEHAGYCIEGSDSCWWVKSSNIMLIDSFDGNL